MKPIRWNPLEGSSNGAAQVSVRSNTDFQSMLRTFPDGFRPDGKDNLRDKLFFEDICIYMDNLAVHRSNTLKERMDEMSIPYIFGPPYSPDYNPIESVFSIFKKEIKTRRLEAVLKKKRFNIKANVKEVFE